MGDEKVKITKEGKSEKLVNKKIKIVVEIERIFDPNRSMNNLMMTMGACEFHDDDDKFVGEVLHGIPAHSVIRDKETGEDWVLNYGNLFEEYKSCRKRLAETEEALAKTSEGRVILQGADAATEETLELAKIKTAGEEDGDEIRNEHMGLDDGDIFK